MSDPGDLEDLAKDYRVALLRYLPRHSEAALTSGYELGRQAASGGPTLLDLVQVHHRVLAELLGGSPAPDPAPLVAAACEFFSEVVSTFDMAHRSLQSEGQPSDNGIGP